MQRPAPLVPLLLLVSGCDWLDALRGYTNPMVMEGLLVGVEAPDPEVMDLTGTEFEGGTAATVLLADAEYVDDLENAPIEGAKVELSLGGGGWRAFRDDADGKYLIEDGLEYVAGQDIEVRIQDGEDHGAKVRAPSPLDVQVPEDQARGEKLVVRTDAQGVTTLAVVVMEVESGEVLFDNRPATIEDAYDLTHGGGSLAVEIPGAVFGRAGAYVVGVAGLAVGGDDNLENLNTTISALTAGTIRFYPVYVAGDVEVDE